MKVYWFLLSAILAFTAPAFARNAGVRAEWITKGCEAELHTKLVYRTLPKRQISYYYSYDGNNYAKTELAEIVSSSDPEIQKRLEFVQQNGGHVRFLKARVRNNPDKKWTYEAPYFWVNLDKNSDSYLIPVIAIDLTVARGLSALAHEMEHFKIWLDRYKLALAEGLDHESATRRAVDDVWKLDMIVYGESRAVAAEMAAEREFADHPFNRPYKKGRPSNFWEEGYVNRVTYPQFQAVRQLLLELRDAPRDGSHNVPMRLPDLDKYIGEMVAVALEARAKALAHLPPGAPGRRYWETAPVLDLLIKPFGSERLKSDNTYGLFIERINAAAAAAGG